MEEYILIFRHENGNKIASPEQIEAWMEQTKNWMNDIAAKHKLVGGKGAAFENAKIVSGPKHAVSNGPFGNKQETVGGYLIVKADSMDEAVEFAKGSPVLQGEGNTVEVRKLVG